MRELLTRFGSRLMCAEDAAVCDAAHGTASPDRTDRRNGYRARPFDTRTGTLSLSVPMLRPGLSCNDRIAAKWLTMPIQSGPT